MKKILILTLVVAIIAMTGTASAAIGSVIIGENGESLDFVEGLYGDVPYTFGLRMIDNNDAINAMPPAGTELTYTVWAEDPSNVTIDMLKTTGTLNGDDPYDELGVFNATISSSAPTHMIYVIHAETTYDIGTGPTTVSSVIEAEVVAHQYIERIPEFPTIALPVAAIIGLAFFMQRRKEE